MRVVEIFKSIQGEGLSVGLPTTFIRCAGCNLKCHWCDTTYARDVKAGKKMKIDYLQRRIEAMGTPNVCITGGEPLLQKDEVYALIDRLVDMGYFIVLETNGSISLEDAPVDGGLSISMDYKLPSSGMNEAMIEDNIDLLGPTDQLKFVVGDRRDYKVARTVLERHDTPAQVIIQPVWGANAADIAQWVLDDNLNVRVIPQIHKYIWDADVRGR